MGKSGKREKGEGKRKRKGLRYEGKEKGKREVAWWGQGKRGRKMWEILKGGGWKGC